MPTGVLPVNYMQCVNKVGRRLTELKNFREEDINGIKKIVNSLHQLAALNN